MMRLILLSALGLTLLAQRPDRAPLPDEWGYRPAEGARVAINPPAFSWVHEKAAQSYTLEWANNADFKGAVRITDLPWTVYTHSAPLPVGFYYWHYRIVGPQGESAWSRVRTFRVSNTAIVFPQPTLAEVKARIPSAHPRLFLRPEDLPRLREAARGSRAAEFRKLIAAADALVNAEPTPEPTVLGNSRNPETRDYWWRNRVQALKALGEAEVLTFAWLITQDAKYAAPARAFTLKLAAWDPDGPTNFALNCEAAKPMLHRLARAYDWAYPLFSEEERARIRAVLLRRAQDAWKSGEVRLGVGHLNQPQSSHANRTWHKLAENAVATLGETPESDLFLRYAVTKFFAAYPVWGDDQGGWHEGLSYLSGYMSKVTWWIDVAQSAMEIDSFKKPFFAHIGDYALYSAPPGTPDQGFGDLAFRPPGSGWSFLHYFAHKTGNRNWEWWLNEWKVREESGEPVLDFLRDTAAAQPEAPAGLPPSKLFEGAGVAVLNSNLLNGLENVQVRFKASPMGRISHGHDAQNSFTLNAYGVALLPNNVYRDLYGSPFHAKWTWTTRAQNAVLVNGQGQKEHSAAPPARILATQFEDGFDYVVGDAAETYEGKLTRARRHIYFVKPDIVFVADELAAPQPSTYQFMLHGQQAFQLDEAGQSLVLDRGQAGVRVDYVAPQPLRLKQWTGYDPAPDVAYLKSVGNPMIPDQWHVEASTAAPTESAFVLTVARVFRDGKTPAAAPRVERKGVMTRLTLGTVRAEFASAGATFRNGDKTWKVRYP